MTKRLGTGGVAGKGMRGMQLWDALQFDAREPRNFADDAAAEQQDADHEDHALHHEHPLADGGEIVLHGDDDEDAPTTGPNTVPSPPTSVISTTSPDIGQSTSVSEASWNTIALVAPATPANVADSTKAISL